eukprot:Nk52_evm1s542 gene=Nk52_evmTU1s542
MVSYKRSPKWAISFSDSSSMTPASQSPPGSSNKTLHELEDRVGSRQKDENEALKLKKAWDVALGPGKSIPMNAFMMYMAGNTVQIFSIMITGMMFFNPVKALFSVGQTFKQFEDMKVDVLIPKLVFVGLNLVCIGMAFYKLQNMGLLPTSSSDWLAFLPQPRQMEYSGGGIVLQ